MLRFSTVASPRSLQLRSDPHRQERILSKGCCCWKGKSSWVMRHWIHQSCHRALAAICQDSAQLEPEIFTEFLLQGKKPWEVNLSEKDSFVKRSPNAGFPFLHAHGKLKVNKLSITIRQLKQCPDQDGNRQDAKEQAVGWCWCGDASHFTLIPSHYMCHISVTGLPHPCSPRAAKGTSREEKKKLARCRCSALLSGCDQQFPLLFKDTKISSQDFCFSRN